jgi:hypothetical protein
MTWATDVLILLTVAKVFWDVADRRLISAELFTLGSLGLAFLLGVSGRMAKDVLRNGLALTVLILFVFTVLEGSFRSAYAWFAAVLVGLYVFGRVVALSGWVVFAVIGLAVGTYLFARLNVRLP